MKPDKLCGLLGLCRRSGRLTMGFDAVVALQKSKRVLVLIAADASPRTAKEVRFRMPTCPLHVLPLSKEELSAVLGLQKPVACVATDDDGFITALLPLLGNEGGIPL